MLGGGAKWCGGVPPVAGVAACYRRSRNPGPNDVGSVGGVVSAQMLIGKGYCTCKTIKDVDAAKRYEAMRALNIPHFSALLDCNFWLGVHVFLSKPQNQGVRLRYVLRVRQALSAARRVWRVDIRTAVALTSKVSATAVTVTHRRKRVIGFYA